MTQFALSVVKIMLYKLKIVFVQDEIIIEQIGKKVQSTFSVKVISDESALYKYYFLKHNDNLDIEKAYKVTFMGQPKAQDLNYNEQFWIDKLVLD